MGLFSTPWDEDNDDDDPWVLKPRAPREFQTEHLLDAVGHLDAIRQAVGDNGYQPPEIRTELLDLHRLAIDVYPDGTSAELADLYEKADDIESIVFELTEHIEHLTSIVESLTTALQADADAYYDEQEQSENDETDQSERLN